MAQPRRNIESRYRIIEVDDGAVLSAALADAIGIRVVVTKHRRLFLSRDVRIHLDRVEQLGEFIELEAVAPPGSDLAHEHDLVVELRAAFGITDERLLAVGYAGQLLSIQASRARITHGTTTIAVSGGTAGISRARGTLPSGGS